MGPEFFQTRMGQKFFEADVPNMIDAMNRLAKAIEEQNALMRSEKEVDTSKEK